ncbi:MAG: hypothetical protein IJ727_07020 [Treponema sp.]|nr:hypothetical protein [Treponema sp.]
MKKPQLLIFLFVFFIPSLFAENSQTVIPKIIYIGDTVEISCFFSSAMNLFGNEQENKAGNLLILKENQAFEERYGDKFTMTRGQLQKTNTEYILKLNLIPWQVGPLRFPRINLADFFDCTPYIIELSPIEVHSLAEKTGRKDFFPQLPPMVLPGTTMILMLIGALSFIFFAFIIFALLHLSLVSRFIKSLAYMYSLKRNSRRAIKKLLALQKEKASFLSDRDISAEIQHILRDFLSKRFKEDFSAVTTSKMLPILLSLSGGEVNENQEETLEGLSNIFRRTDFIRFSKTSFFLQEERKTILQDAIKLIEDFDRDEN